MEEFFNWSDKYSVGNDELDDQHRTLFDLGNRIIAAPLAEAPDYCLHMFSYIRKHFTAEEAHMASIGYPDIADHRVLHDRLISDYNRSVEHGIGDDQAFRKFKIFLFRWLTEHILEHDRNYFDFARTLRSPK